MKYLKQFLIIVAVTALGEGCHALIPLPVPGSVYGLVLMLVCLLTGLVKLPQIEETAAFLIQIMPLLFVPATSGLMDSFEEMRAMLVPLFVIGIVTTFIVAAVAGKVADVLMSVSDRPTGGGVPSHPAVNHTGDPDADSRPKADSNACNRQKQPSDADGTPEKGGRTS